MFQNTLGSVSVIALTLAATGALVLISRRNRSIAHSRSRRIECYYRDLKKIDQQEANGKLNEEAAEQARALLLKSMIAVTPPRADFVKNLPNYRSPAMASMVGAIALLGAVNFSGGASDHTTATGAGQSLASQALASMSLLPGDAAAAGLTKEQAAQSESDLKSLEDYAKTIGGSSGPVDFSTMFGTTAGGSTTQSAPMSTPPSLPDVDTMISRLAARLKKSPDDVEGWRMLGWSYFNTKHYTKSIAAYQHALKLNPGSAPLQAALNEAKAKIFASTDKPAVKPATGPTAKSAEKSATKSAAKSGQKAAATSASAAPAKAPVKNAPVKNSAATDSKGDSKKDSKDTAVAATSTSTTAAGRSAGSGSLTQSSTQDSLSPTSKVATAPRGPTKQDIENAKTMQPADRQAMIVGMVNRLAARLEKSPRDAAGWQRLIHSRMVLGDKPAAQKALAQALQVFASEPKIKATITAAAQKSGVQLTNTN